MTAADDTRELDVHALLGLAHPLRIGLLDRLTRIGPATATMLADALGESSGSTSYHLRILARHGFIVEDREHPRSGRERWWRAAAGGIHLRGYDLLNDDATRSATRLLVGEVQRRARDRLRRWFDESTAWPKAWQEASTDSVYAIQLDADRAAALRDELHAVLVRYHDLPAEPDAREVEVHLNLFPTGDPP